MAPCVQDRQIPGEFTWKFIKMFIRCRKARLKLMMSSDILLSGRIAISDSIPLSFFTILTILATGGGGRDTRRRLIFFHNINNCFQKLKLDMEKQTKKLEKKKEAVGESALDKTQVNTVY